LECARDARCRRRRGASTIAADRQADQCRVSQRSFDSTGQYHDARTDDRRRASGAASTSGRDQCADTGAASGCGVDCGQKATRTEIPSGRAGSALAGSRRANSRYTGSRRGQRLILPKADTES
jgi:hypothetical protein